MGIMNFVETQGLASLPHHNYIFRIQLLFTTPPIGRQFACGIHTTINTTNIWLQNSSTIRQAVMTEKNDGLIARIGLVGWGQFNRETVIRQDKLAAKIELPECFVYWICPPVKRKNLPA